MVKFIICLLRALKARNVFNDLYEKGFIKKKYAFKKIYKKELEIYETNKETK